ncbi:molybdopterin molybdotransferase MoeA [Chryseolinea lacunae]|uniref:Molybdopterin molybdenumtransferase n=1 Tax=Chryseolinea lacunae TaxID=2801331 RepID=A0ABS1KVP4_9BACT|nr:molybdopterin molybdotransferase MoeA [Chryseolinea lacunae]MBL0742762.1 molybdopterin molybdotransferase MoeA [Chryseolinea lacunae]
MVSVAEATSVIFSHLFRPGQKRVALTAAVGQVLAEPVYADRDFPPFDRVAMDGMAIHRDTWLDGQHAFLLEAVQAAGEPRKKLTQNQNAIEVMTGAMLPEGTDMVIRYEDLTIANKVAAIAADTLKENGYIHRQGADCKKDALLLEPGLVLSPAEIALLASVGKSSVNVFAFPRTAIVASGDELVEVDAVPEPHQIRRSNTFAIQAAMQTLGWAGESHHVKDDKAGMTEALTALAAANDVIILSGGVSKGKFDFVPDVLEAIGVKKLFHQVSQRPGKPFWFGVSDKGLTVFALPGNPVSTYMCFYRYIRPWVMQSLGVTEVPLMATLATDFSFAPPLTYFLQVTVKNENGTLMAYPDAGGGSGDFANLKKVTGFLELPLNQSAFKAGESFPYIPFRG